MPAKQIRSEISTKEQTFLDQHGLPFHSVWIVKGIAEHESQMDYIESVWITEGYALDRIRELSRPGYSFEYEEWDIQGE